MGLLNAQRSKSNYRIYSEEALFDLQFIEECKLMYFPLEEIKRKLEIKKEKMVCYGEVEKQIQTVTQQMKQLQNELSVLKPLLEQLDDQQRINVLEKLKIEGNDLTASLFSLKTD